MAGQGTGLGSYTDPPEGSWDGGSWDGWLNLDPHEAPPTGLGAPFHGALAEGIIGYQVDGDWRRGPDGHWFRWYRAAREDGRHAVGRATSPSSAYVQLEVFTFGPYVSLYLLGLPLAVGAAVILVVVGAVDPASAVAGAVVGVAVVAVAWEVLGGRFGPAVQHLEAPGNFTWRHAPRALSTGVRLLCLLPAVVTVATAIALARRG